MVALRDISPNVSISYTFVMRAKSRAEKAADATRLRAGARAGVGLRSLGGGLGCQGVLEQIDGGL